jgi:Flp pilus assembly pilin Flp
MLQRLRRLWSDEEGQDVIEYSLLITFIAIATMWFVAAGRPTVNAIWTGANQTITTANTTAVS